MACPYGLDAALQVSVQPDFAPFDEVHEEDGTWRPETSGAYHESDADFRDRQQEATSIAPYLEVLPHLVGVLSDKQREVVDAMLAARKQADLASQTSVRKQTVNTHLNRAKQHLHAILAPIMREAVAVSGGTTTQKDGLVSLARLTPWLTPRQALILVELVAGGHRTWYALAKAAGGSPADVTKDGKALARRLAQEAQADDIDPEEIALVGMLVHPASATSIPIRLRRSLSTQAAAVYVSRYRYADVLPTPQRTRLPIMGNAARILDAAARSAVESLDALDAALPPARPIDRR